MRYVRGHHLSHWSRTIEPPVHILAEGKIQDVSFSSIGQKKAQDIIFAPIGRKNTFEIQGKGQYSDKCC